MQTFLPYLDFGASARVLDRQRLGKQRVEALMILRVLLRDPRGPEPGWAHHPAVLMWKGHELMLLEYLAAVCTEWKRRGYIDSCLSEGLRLCHLRLFHPVSLPWWLGLPEFHLSHQSNLLRKAPWLYGMHFHVPDDLPYYWPERVNSQRGTR